MSRPGLEPIDVAKTNRDLADALGFDVAELEQNLGGRFSPRQLTQVAAYGRLYWVGGAIVGTMLAIGLGALALWLPEKDRTQIAPFLPYFAIGGVLLTVIVVVYSARARPDARRGLKSVRGPVRYVDDTGDGGCAMYVGKVMFALTKAQHDRVAAIAPTGTPCTAYIVEASPVPVLLSMGVDAAAPG